MGKLNGNARSRLIRKKVIPIFAAFTFFLLLLSTRTIGALWSEQFSLVGNVSLGSWSFTPTPSPFQPVDPGTTLKANITANIFVPQTGDVLSSGGLRLSTYGLEGAVCIGNNGANPTEGLYISATIQIRSKGEVFEDLLVFPVEVAGMPTLSPGGRYCYPYGVIFESLPETNLRYRIGAAITLTNYSDWTPGSENCPGPEVCPYGPWVTAQFTLPIPPTERVEPTRTPQPTRNDSSEQTPQPTSTALPSSTPTAAYTEVPATATPPPEQRWTPTQAPTATPVKPTSAPPIEQTPVPQPSGTLSPTPDPPSPQPTVTSTPEYTPTLEAQPVVDLALDHLEEKFTASAGSVVVFQLSYANLGSAAASGVVITTALPAHTRFNPEMNSPGWSGTDSSEGYTFALGELAPGDSGAVLFAVLVDDPLPDEVQSIANTASISDDGSQGSDIDLGNNTSTSQVPVGHP